MNYTILIYETPADFAVRHSVDTKQREDYRAAWPPYSKALKDAGIFVSGAGLQAPETGTTLRFEGVQRLVQDGPYADTKEQLGGFFMIDVPDLDTALDWAARCPHRPGNAIEVRPNLPPMS
ncbi:MAG: YciI family protein [Acidobacteriota bacterium]|nr:YciI family protein [Acidobacteriota bacterium]